MAQKQKFTNDTFLRFGKKLAVIILVTVIVFSITSLVSYFISDKALLNYKTTAYNTSIARHDGGRAYVIAFAVVNVFAFSISLAISYLFISIWFAVVNYKTTIIQRALGFGIGFTLVLLALGFRDLSGVMTITEEAQLFSAAVTLTSFMVGSTIVAFAYYPFVIVFELVRKGLKQTSR